MKSCPDISFVITVYNTESYLPEALDKLLECKFGDISYEIIIIDDSSPGDPNPIVSNYKSKCDIRIVRHDVNHGNYRAKITGYAMAKGNYVMVLDSDDFVVKVEVDHLEPFFSFIENGVGWGLVTPTFMATYPEKMKNIQILPMPSPIVSRDIYVLGRNELSYQNLTDSITKICQTSIHQSLKKLFIPYVLWSKNMFLTYGENNRKVPLFV